MSWRVVVIRNRAKLDLSMQYMVVRSKTTKRIYLGEISVLIIESTAVSLTASLLSELVKRKIKILFCDEKRNPESELVSIYGSHDVSSKIRTQILWSKDIKNLVWLEIVRNKIIKQRDYLMILNEKDRGEILNNYIDSIEDNDSTNREAHAAKVYFNTIYGKEFNRTDQSLINSGLNYGYTILLSAFNREVVSNGYLTQIGIFHDSMFNYFNLSSDLMEPFRILVDKKIREMELEKFTVEEKSKIVDILNDKIEIDSQITTILNAIKIYTKSVFDALNNKDTSLIKFYKLESNTDEF